MKSAKILVVVLAALLGVPHALAQTQMPSREEMESRMDNLLERFSKKTDAVLVEAAEIVAESPSVLPGSPGAPVPADNSPRSLIDWVKCFWDWLNEVAEKIVSRLASAWNGD